jgi:hypothetical protein
MALSSDLAGGRTNLGSTDFEELLAGDAPVVTDYADIVTDGSTSFQKFEVVALDTVNNRIIKHVPGGTGDQKVAVGVLAQPIGINSNTQVPYFAAGFFNSDLLVWEASLNTFAKRKAVFLRTPILVGTLTNV